jgi:hypothetical protein
MAKKKKTAQKIVVWGTIIALLAVGILPFLPLSRVKAPQNNTEIETGSGETA